MEYPELDVAAIDDWWPENEPAPVERIVLLLLEVGRYATIASNPESRFAIAMDDRLRSPQPGDWVVETSKFTFDVDAVAVFVGRLWDMNHPDGKDQDEFNHLWRCRSVDGRFHNWSNSEFRVLPTRKIQKSVMESLEHEIRG